MEYLHEAAEGKFAENNGALCILIYFRLMVVLSVRRAVKASVRTALDRKLSGISAGVAADRPK